MKSMLRISEGSEIRAVASIIPRWFEWHPYHVTIDGTSPPCHHEFMELMQCLDETDSSQCVHKYTKLLQCLHRQGMPVHRSPESDRESKE